MSWLSGRQIKTKIAQHADKETRDSFFGIFSIDKLPFAVPHYPYFMIVNTQAHNLPGEHWITIFIDKNRKGEVFDSLALPLSNFLIRWLNRFTRSFTVNNITYQHPLSSTCGAFALYFVLHRLKDPHCMTNAFDVNLYENSKRIFDFYYKLK